MAAEILYTIDSGVNFDAITGPFAATEDILSAVCFAVNNSANRWLVTRGAEAAPTNPAEVAYSDDTGAAWSNVYVEAAGTRVAVDSDALFAIDKRHIWLVISGGYIFFSDDGGETWTPQSEGTVTTEDLRGVHFADPENGMACGDSGKVLKTDDGGVTWSEVTDITGTPDVLTVQMLDKNTAMVGTSDGKIYMTFNGGTSWTQKYSISGGTVDSINVVNKFVAWAVSNTGGPIGTVIRSRNGGHSWESITTPTNTGLNSITGLSSNKAWAVGNDGIIVKVSG